MVVCPPCRSRSSWPLRVLKIDSTVWRSDLKNFPPGLSGSDEGERSYWSREATDKVAGLSLIAFSGLLLVERLA